MKDLSTPFMDAARQRHQEFEAHLAALPPLRWHQRLYMLWYCWWHGL